MALMEDPEARGDDRPRDPSGVGAKAAINLTKSNVTKQELQKSLQEKIAKSISPTWKAWLRDFDNEIIQDDESQHALAANNHDAIQSMISPPSPSAPRTMTPTSQNDIEHDYQAPDDMHMPATTEDVDLQTQLAQASAVVTSTYNGLDSSAGEKRKKEPIRAQEKPRKHIRNADDYTGSHANDLPSPAISNSSLSGAHRELDSMQQPPAPLSLLERETNYRIPSSLPAWSLAISPASLEMKMLDKKRPQSLTALLALKGCIARCAAESSELARWRLFDELRDHIHKAEIKLDVNKFIVKKSNVLTPQNGLPQIFREDADYPADLKADSFQLYTRWYQGIFVQDILRGIDLIKGKDRNGDRLNPDYRKEHPSDARVYGYNGLVLGQWWPTQLCTVRDGAHGAAQGGVFGAKDKGAFSVVVSGGGGYHDEDHGNEIFYSGTNGKSETPTENTLHMIKSIELQNPIRVIRSHMLGKSNKFRPEVGFRFDGLYVVKSKQLVDKEKAAYHFRLVRCDGQQPIRCGSNAASRPTVFEVEEYQRLKAEKKWM